MSKTRLTRTDDYLPQLPMYEKSQIFIVSFSCKHFAFFFFFFVVVKIRLYNLRVLNGDGHF